MMAHKELQETDIVKETALSIADKSQDSATPTPRSVSTSCGGSSALTPRSPAKSGVSDSDDDDSNGGSDVGESASQDEYAAFLRELAGSFEATSEDESDTSSENGSSDEEEVLSSPLRKNVKGSALSKLSGAQRLSGIRRRSSLLSTTSGESVEDDDSELSTSMLTPRRDFREPVKDDYDVVQAALEFAQGRPGTWLEQRREDLHAQINLKQAQAHSLLGPASNPTSSPEVRAHYASVRADFLREAQAFQLELAALDRRDEPSHGGDYEVEALGFVFAESVGACSWECPL